MIPQISRYGNGFEVVYKSHSIFHSPNPQSDSICQLIAQLPVIDLERLLRARKRLTHAWLAPVRRHGQLTSHSQDSRDQY